MGFKYIFHGDLMLVQTEFSQNGVLMVIQWDLAEYMRIIGCLLCFSSLFSSEKPGNPWDLTDLTMENRIHRI